MKFIDHQSVCWCRLVRLGSDSRFGESGSTVGEVESTDSKVWGGLVRVEWALIRNGGWTCREKQQFQKGAQHQLSTPEVGFWEMNNGVEACSLIRHIFLVSVGADRFWHSGTRSGTDGPQGINPGLCLVLLAGASRPFDLFAFWEGARSHFHFATKDWRANGGTWFDTGTLEQSGSSHWIYTLETGPSST